MAELRPVKGLSACLENLRKLPQRLQTKVVRGATNDAAKVVQEQAIENAPLYTEPIGPHHAPAGTLKKAIVRKYAKERSSDTRTAYIVTVRKGRKGQVMIDAFYWWWVEFGSVHNEARKFMRDAFMQKAGAAIDRFASRVRERLQEVTKP